MGICKTEETVVLWLLGQMFSCGLRPSLTAQFAEPDEERKWTYDQDHKKLQSYERECSSATPSLPEFKVANCVTITFSLSWPYFTPNSYLIIT
jgi:hypothetical protein